MKNKGPKMDPWETPHLMVCSEEQVWLIWKNCWRQEKVRVRWSNSLTFSKKQLDGSPIESCSFTILLVNLQTIGRGPEVAILVGIRWAISMSWFEISIPAALKRLIYREAVWKADSCVYTFAVVQLNLQSFRLGMTANLGVTRAV